jgi:hypothetical protein
LSIYFDLGRASQYLDFAIQVCHLFLFFWILKHGVVAGL